MGNSEKRLDGVSWLKVCDGQFKVQKLREYESILDSMVGKDVFLMLMAN